MKKMSYLAIGIALGVGLSTGGEALAAVATSLIGKSVTSELTVYVDYKPLAEKAPTLDGRAYLPVRKMAEAVGMQLTLNGDKIYLKTPPATIVQVNNPTNPQSIEIPTDRELTPEEVIKFSQELSTLNIQIGQLESRLKSALDGLSSLQGNGQNNQATFEFTFIQIDAYNKQLAELKERRTAIEKAIGMKNITPRY